MKKRWLFPVFLCLVSILIVPGLTGCDNRTANETSVLEGRVLIGPRLPEEIKRPYPAEVYQPRKVMVYDADHSELLRELDLDENGYYSAELPPGNYTIDIKYYGTDTSDTVPKKIKIDSGVSVDRQR